LYRFHDTTIHALLGIIYRPSAVNAKEKKQHAKKENKMQIFVFFMQKK